MSAPLKSDDPAFWMLETGKRLEAEGVTGDRFVGPDWLKEKPIHREGCYICEDPEFRLMGMPLCQPCPDCASKGKEGHIPADDACCEDCGYDLQEAYMNAQDISA